MMSLQTLLDELRAELPACKRTAFGDLSAQLALRSSSNTPCSREMLDGACRTAKAVFDALSENPGAGPIDATVFASTAIVFDATTTHIFARQGAEAEDVVLAEIAGGQPITNALSKVKAMAGHLAETPS